MEDDFCNGAPWDSALGSFKRSRDASEDALDGTTPLYGNLNDFAKHTTERDAKRRDRFNSPLTPANGSPSPEPTNSTACAPATTSPSFARAAKAGNP